MKKLMISTIVILPLIILAILLVSGAIVSLTTHIYVETVEFTDNEDIVLVMGDEENPPEYNLRGEINVLPLKATNRSLSYLNYDENLVRISGDGVITPLFYGETYVTVQSKENKAATATRKIIVTDVSVHALKMNAYEADLYEGESQRLSVAVYPEEAENKAIKWVSSDDGILRVGADGTVTALKNGSAVVTAVSLDDEEVTARATINCHAKLKGLDFDRSELITSFKEVNFPAVVTNPAVCDADIEYSCDAPEIAAVDGNGKITFSKEGSVTVTVKATDFKGNVIKASKKFTSTFGYFGAPLFKTKTVDFADCASGILPSIFSPGPVGAYRLIGDIKCYLDSTAAEGDCLDDLIFYDEVSKLFKVNGELPAFNKQIFVLVRGTVYDYKTHSLNAAYEDYFYITKEEIKENVKVSCGGVEFTADEENPVGFSDVGEQVFLTVENPDNLIVQIVGNTFVNAVYDGNTVTLTAMRACDEGDGVTVRLSVGTKIYILKISVKAKAQSLGVSCDGVELSDGETYKTLIGTLSFELEKRRDDGQKVASPVEYSLNGSGEWKEAVGDKITVDTLSADKVTLRCDGVEFSFGINKTVLTDFGLKSSVTHADGSLRELETVASVKDGNGLKFTLPSNIQHTFTLKPVVDFNDYLGGFGTDDEFEALFSVDFGEDDGWKADYNVAANQIVLTFVGNEFDKSVSLSCGDLKISIELCKIIVNDVSFKKGAESYDSQKAEDVYPGYQQARVFAKHSYYGADVDYFRIPFKALRSIATQVKAPADSIAWNLYRYVGDERDCLLASQFGKTVTVGDKSYKIVQNGGEYVLKDGDSIVSGANGKNTAGIIWVDAFTEEAEGYARIYFGNFAGLSESDVYNDYFGAFDDKPWSKPAECKDDKDGGIIIAPSANAYSFLRVEAGDGAEGGVNCHFNFNVLDADDVINVFDAAGYYCKDKMVLHTSLYGPGELESADPALVLDSPKNVSKSLIYGNGNHINLMARNTQLIEEAKKKNDEKRLGYHNGAAFIAIYNLTLMGSNPTEEIKPLNQAMVFRIQNAYYCDIQYLAKINTYCPESIPDTDGSKNPDGTPIPSRESKDSAPLRHDVSYIKNTVIRYASRSGYQLGYENDGAYFENVVFTESFAAITLENRAKNAACHFKGFCDVLNYYTPADLSEYLGFPRTFGAEFYADPQSVAASYSEWFGKDNGGTSDLSYAIEHRFVNTVVFDTTMNNTNKILFWQNDGSGYSAENADIRTVMNLMGMAVGWTYDRTVEFDGGIYDGAAYTTRDMSRLFDNPEYIRLLCEYKCRGSDGKLVKNTDHILWHMQKVHRNVSLILNRTSEHIDSLIKSLEGVRWQDGTGVSDGKVIGVTPASINRLLSTAILPERKAA